LKLEGRRRKAVPCHPTIIVGFRKDCVARQIGKAGAMLSEGMLSICQKQGWEMMEEELSNDPVMVSEKACVEIETVRKNLQTLCEQLAMTNNSAKEIARNESCRALVRRLELAEREVVELTEMINLARKSQ
jgi:cob(I)alamin adenosyltransferase